MPPLDRDQLLADLNRDENVGGKFSPVVYDDATGEPVVPGYVMKGNATLCTGWCPAKNPCTAELNTIITGYWVDKSDAALFATAPWIADQPEPVQRALANMAFNEGVHGLMGFTTFLSLIQQDQYDAAADDLAGTAWFRQVKDRGPRIQALIRQGAEA